jgi:hypothetical protein
MDYIKASELTATMLSAQPIGIPIVLCSNTPRTIRRVYEAGYKELCLNKDLSEKMMTVPQQQRPDKILPELYHIVSEYNSPVLLTNFEMLFDPRYKLDVLKVFCEISRTIKIVVHWCGTTSGYNLIYSEPGFPDYHVYELSKYTVISVK